MGFNKYQLGLLETYIIYIAIYITELNQRNNGSKSSPPFVSQNDDSTSCSFRGIFHPKSLGSPGRCGFLGAGAMSWRSSMAPQLARVAKGACGEV